MYTTKVIKFKVFLYYFQMSDSSNNTGIMNQSPRVVFYLYFIYYLVAYLIFKIKVQLLHFPLCFSPSKPNPIPFLSHFQIQSLFSHNHFYKHIYVCIYINISKYNLLILYSVTLMYIFRADHLALKKQL